ALLIDVDNARLSLITAFPVVKHDDIVPGRGTVAYAHPDLRITPFLLNELASQLAAKRVLLRSSDSRDAGNGDVVFRPRGCLSRREASVARDAAVLNFHQLDVGRRYPKSKFLLNGCNQRGGRLFFDVLLPRIF